MLRGVITGLERSDPQAGPLFEELAARVQGICSYPRDVLEVEHLRQAPEGIPVYTVQDLGRDSGVARPGQALWWAPEHLSLLRDLLPPGEPMALFGPGPVWLYAALAVHAAPADFYLFDARHFGWIAPPPAVLNSHQPNEGFTLQIRQETGFVRLLFTRDREHYVIQPRTVHVPPIVETASVVLDGPMPIWLLSALAQALRRQTSLAVYDPRLPSPAPILESPPPA